MSKYKVSFCIPTYNGEETLPHLVDCLVSQIKDRQDVEIVFSDDKSKDQTVKLLRSYQEKYSYIKVFENEKNLGMDGNFFKSVELSSGDFSWLCGQDDYFKEDTIDNFFKILEIHPDINFIYWNYHFYSGDLSRIIADPALNITTDSFFETSDEYFKELDSPPSFLPATVMKREFWIKFDKDAYQGTYYIQVGVWLESFKKGKVYVVANPEYVYCRCPEDSWKFTSGQMLFEIYIGTLMTYTIAQIRKNVFPSHLYLKHRDIFLKNLLYRKFKFTEMGYVPREKNIKMLKTIFSKKPFVLWFYVMPIVFFPRVLIKVYYLIKNL